MPQAPSGNLGQQVGIYLDILIVVSQLEPCADHYTLKPLVSALIT